jgi:hypothetical protein
MSREGKRVRAVKSGLCFAQEPLNPLCFGSGGAVGVLQKSGMRDLLPQKKGRDDARPKSNREVEDVRSCLNKHLLKQIYARPTMGSSSIMPQVHHARYALQTCLRCLAAVLTR